MASIVLLAQALPSTSSGVDWLYQFTNNLTNLTTQNGGALTQLGMTELACISFFMLVSMVINWQTSTMTFRLHHHPIQAGDPNQILAPAHHLLSLGDLLGQSVPWCELRYHPLLFLHRTGNGCGVRPKLARLAAPIAENRRRQHRHAGDHGTDSDPLLFLCAGAIGTGISHLVSH